MRLLLIFSLVEFCASQAIAQACWVEHSELGQKVVRAGSCYENVSDREFERNRCKSQGDGGELRTGASCPAQVNLQEASKVVSRPVIASCLNFRPGMSEGVLNIHYYSDPRSFGSRRSSLQSTCLGHAGRWTEKRK
jgi:hypothetical protein